MEEPDVNNYLWKEDLFELFKAQLKKDFESAGASGDFVNDLPVELEVLKSTVTAELVLILKTNGSLLASLLYRIDISERQLQQYQDKNLSLSFEEIIAELIIKRILQKVILKKTFS